LPLKLNSTVLLDRRLLNRDHLPLHLGKFSGGLFVTADQEGCWPEDDHRATASLVRWLSCVPESAAARADIDCASMPNCWQVNDYHHSSRRKENSQDARR
jgi:hypothetical protein